MTITLTNRQTAKLLEGLRLAIQWEESSIESLMREVPGSFRMFVPKEHRADVAIRRRNVVAFGKLIRAVELNRE